MSKVAYTEMLKLTWSLTTDRDLRVLGQFFVVATDSRLSQAGHVAVVSLHRSF